MFDTHYDLLTELYISYLYHDFSRVDRFCKNFHQGNVTGVIANLCFMSDEEMKKEYHKDYWKPDVSVLEMFGIATNLARLKVSEEVCVYYSIEGCDKLLIEELEPLYQLGLRVIAPVWNETNCYGSGIRGNGGLTFLGRKLLNEAVRLGIAIDLSHANETTFYDILDEIKKAQKLGQHPVFFASHSNVKGLCNRERNLTDRQILELTRLGGKIGIFSNASFVVKDALRLGASNEILKDQYVCHIQHVLALTQNEDAVMLATDDMTWGAMYANDLDYVKLSIFSYDCLAFSVIEMLQQAGFNDDLISKLLYQNAYYLLQ